MFNDIFVSHMRRQSKILILLAPFFIICISLFFGLFQCYCLTDADFLGSPAIEATDLLSQPSCSLGDDKFFALNSHHNLLISYENILKQLAAISFHISSFDLITHILRC
jgi:hypothetical protein